jgi:hypothetical protein
MIILMIYVLKKFLHYFNDFYEPDKGRVREPRILGFLEEKVRNLLVSSKSYRELEIESEDLSTR